MPVQVDWDNAEKTILRQTYGDAWTRDDIREMLDRTYELIGEVDHTVHIIADMTANASLMPTKLLSFVSQLESKPQDNRGLWIGIGFNAYVRAIASAARKIAPKSSRDVHFVNSQEEAYALIDEAEVLNQPE